MNNIKNQYCICESLVQSFDQFLNLIIFSQKLPEFMLIQTEWNYFKTILNDTPISKDKINRYLVMLKQNKVAVSLSKTLKKNTPVIQTCHAYTQTQFSEKEPTPKTKKINGGQATLTLQKVLGLNELLTTYQELKQNETAKIPISQEFAIQKNEEYYYHSAKLPTNHSPQLNQNFSSSVEQNKLHELLDKNKQNERKQISARLKLQNRSSYSIKVYFNQGTEKKNERSNSYHNLYQIKKVIINH